jgi:hypothetical protein
MQHPLAANYKRLWAAVAVVLLLVIYLLSWLNAKLSNIAAASKSQTADTSNPLNLSPADAARRKAIAGLGFIQQHHDANAAAIYRQAIDLFNKLTGPEKIALQDWRTKLDPTADAALDAKLQAILQLMRDARYADKSDWGPDPLKSDNRYARRLAMEGLTEVATWDANYRFQSDPTTALGDLAAAEALNRDAGGTFAGFGTYTFMRTHILQVVAENANALDGAQSADLDYLTDTAGMIGASQEIFTAQAGMLQDLLDQYASSDTNAHAADIIKTDMLGFMNPVKDVPGAVPVMQWLIQIDQQLPDTIAAPDAIFRQWYTQTKASAAAIPIATTAMWTIQNQRETILANESQDVMIQAGIALLQGNQSQFQTILDPATNQPFVIHQLPQGFELTSPLNKYNNPVSLTFGSVQSQ